jgi:23S rRNA (cytosine1962-C5)-methyltransferase
VLFEDEHLLVVNKPAGINTHAPAPFAGEGVYDWLRHREPRWASLATIHRLDKETSGVIVFARSPLANRSLTGQFAIRAVQKRYLLVSDRPVPSAELRVTTRISRVGDRYASGPNGEHAETVFRPANLVFGVVPGCAALVAEPLTGRTHQIRVHAAESGFPILGDTLYGGTPAARVFLHAEQLSFAHPATGQPATFTAPPAFEEHPRRALRAAFLGPDTDAFRLIHGAADGWPGWYVDVLGEFVLSQSAQELTPAQLAELDAIMAAHKLRGVHHKRLERRVRQTTVAEASPKPCLGAAAPDRFAVRENGLTFELSFNEGYSVGLFLDQRDNRRRLLASHVAAGLSLFAAETKGATLLNAFAYTCGFSVAAARAGLHTTSLDLSRKYLDWGRRNFALNGLDPEAPGFIYGDVFEWLQRLAKKGRRFDCVVLDPPTFSQSKQGGRFLAERDFARLAAAAVKVLSRAGLLLVSTNAAKLAPADFLAMVRQGIAAGGREVAQEQYFPQPPDFPISRDEPAYLKSVWVRTN